MCKSRVKIIFDIIEIGLLDLLLLLRSSLNRDEGLSFRGPFLSILVLFDWFGPFDRLPDAASRGCLEGSAHLLLDGKTRMLHFAN